MVGNFDNRMFCRLASGRPLRPLRCRLSCLRQKALAEKSSVNAAAETTSARRRSRPVSTLVPRVFHRLPRSLLLYSRIRMSDRTETLAVGSRAPEFLLSAANRDGILSLSGFLSRGALIVEFLRGTW